MNDHDRDLILGLATGSLSETDAAAARSRIASDPELAAELAEQQAAIEALSTVEPVAMTAEERSGLRTELIAQLHLDETPAVVPATPERQGVAWWKPVFGLGAAAVFVMAIVVTPGLLGGSDDADDTATEFVASADAITTTTLAASATEESGSDSGGAAEGTETTDELSAFDGSDLLSLVSGRSAPDVSRQSSDLAGLAPIDPETEARLATCLEDVADEFPTGAEFITLGASPADEALVFVAVDTGDGVTEVITIDVDACTIVDRDA